MCTITWILEDSSYEIFFNRDELRSRSEAIAPKRYKTGSISAIYPKDPDGLGSWIFTNDHGITGALLNYNIKIPQRDFISRGTLMTEICHQSKLEGMTDTIKNKNLKNYRGFTLCLFKDKHEPRIIRWDGSDLIQLSPVQPIMSSSVEIEKVKINRNDIYNTIVKQNGDNRKSHLEFHSSHIPHKCYLSTCMHRPDAKTVSFSHIICNEKEVKFFYMGHSPCQNSDTVSITAIRTK